MPKQLRKLSGPLWIARSLSGSITLAQHRMILGGLHLLAIVAFHRERHKAITITVGVHDFVFEYSGEPAAK